MTLESSGTVSPWRSGGPVAVPRRDVAEQASPPTESAFLLVHAFAPFRVITSSESAALAAMPVTSTCFAPPLRRECGRALRHHHQTANATSVDVTPIPTRPEMQNLPPLTVHSSLVAPRPLTQRSPLRRLSRSNSPTLPTPRAPQKPVPYAGAVPRRPAPLRMLRVSTHVRGFLKPKGPQRTNISRVPARSQALGHRRRWR